MDKSMKNPELLMPAGSFSKLQIALHYGADAVYAGVPLFSLRARENSFTQETIARAVEYTHSFKKRIYLTMNIYAHNNRVMRFLDAFGELYDLHPDGFIMTDVGLIQRVLKKYPDAVIHLSTQANATNWASVEFWRDLGVKRVILSRELSVAEIAEIHDRVPDVELECFVHGAICIAYSGRCLISNYLNHRDANHGVCSNSCRWQYKLAVDEGSLRNGYTESKMGEAEAQEHKALDDNYFVQRYSPRDGELRPERFEIDEDENGTYLMNSKDLCAVELLEDLRRAGVVSFKVEGRNKSEYYTGTVARAYRRAIDDMCLGRPFDPDNLRELAACSSRTMMTGFLEKRPRHYGENYDDGYSEALSHRYVGIVSKSQDVMAGGGVECDDSDKCSGWVRVLTKNQIRVGDTLEWLCGGQTVEHYVSRIMDDKGREIEVAHGGMSYLLEAPDQADSFSILRKRI